MAQRRQFAAENCLPREIAGNAKSCGSYGVRPRKTLDDVSHSLDLTLRAPDQRSDQIGLTADAFNVLLTRIEREVSVMASSCTRCTDSDSRNRRWSCGPVGANAAAICIDRANCG
ncbi:hypothetical protein PSAC2689_70187 [Paraburkholderia sacchari]